jgi:hypothetical protein
MRGLANETIKLIMFARSLLAELHPMTLRQLHYAIFSAAVLAYENTAKAYKRLSVVTSRARNDYRALELAGETKALESQLLIPPEWMVDEQRPPEMVSMWDNVNEFLDTVKGAYRRDYWQNQPGHTEVWSEKATVLGSLRPLKQKYGVTLRPCKGFGSTTIKQDIGRLFEGISKPITIYFVGDFDPSGDQIDADMKRKVEAASGREFEMLRLAIFQEDIKTYGLPPQKINDDDSRAKRFRKKYGKNAKTVELDALPVEVLRDRVEAAILSEIDQEQWNRTLMVEQVELKCIADFVERVKNLPQAEL